MKFPAIASLALVASIALPQQSRAAEVYRHDVRAAADVCRPALPAYDGMIRVRPLAIVNESSSTAWVTCAVTGDMVGTTSVIEVVFTGAGNGTRTCTLVSWRANGSGTTGVSAVGYQPGSTSTLQGWESRIRWTHAIHNGGARYASAAVSCPLAPGDGIHHLTHMYSENVGQ